MPQPMSFTVDVPVQSINDPSNLTEGWKPALLLDITEEDTPQSFQMYQSSPRMWRYHFAVWQDPSQVGQYAPEHQTAPASKKLKPAGRAPASKAYLWNCELLGREIMPGESGTLNFPVPCRVKIKRKDIYANVMDLERWEEGRQFLTEGFIANLMQWWQQKQAVTPPPTPPQTRIPQENVTAWPGTVQGGPIHAAPPAAPVQAQTPPAPPAAPSTKKGW